MEDDAEIDVLSEHPAQHALASPQHLVQVECHRGHDLLAGEREQLAGEDARALSRLPDVLDQRRVDRDAGLEVVPDVVDPGEDHRQEVVEVVRHAPASRPTLSSFCAWWKTSSSRRCSVTSRALITTPWTAGSSRRFRATPSARRQEPSR